MATTYTKDDTSTTNKVEIAYTAGPPNDIYASTRFYTRINLASYAGSGDATLYGVTGDGHIIQTQTLATGGLPDFTNP